jgi:hypothetical protein
MDHRLTWQALRQQSLQFHLLPSLALCEANPEASCHNHEAAACHMVASGKASAGESIWVWSQVTRTFEPVTLSVT